MAEVPVVFDVPEAARQRGQRRPSVLRDITPTRAQRRRLYAAYRPIVDAWQRHGRETILREYERTLATFTGDSPADIEAAIEASEDGALQLLLQFQQDSRRFANSMEAWHLRQLGQRLTYATNVELSTPMLGHAGGTVEDFLARNTALVRDVSDQTRGRIADIVFRGLQRRAPVRDVAREITLATGMARARAKRIASDQTVKLSSALDDLRGKQLGFPGYEWMHSHKLNFRPEHLARDGKFFKFGSDVDKTDPPGHLPFCGCKRRLSMGPAAEYQETESERAERLSTEAREYVLENGRRAGVEYLTAFDIKTGQVLGRTSGTQGHVGFTPEFEAAISDPKRHIVARHNHPRSSSFSGQDIRMLGRFKGLRELWADGHDGSAYRATRARRNITEAALSSADTMARRAIQAEVTAGSITVEAAGTIHAHAVMSVLAARGHINYTATLAGSRAETTAKYQTLIDRIVANASTD